MAQQRSKSRMNKGTKHNFEGANFSGGYRPTQPGPLPEEWRVVNS
jgi:hypothetical protein